MAFPSGLGDRVGYLKKLFDESSTCGSDDASETDDMVCLIEQLTDTEQSDDSDEDIDRGYEDSKFFIGKDAVTVWDIIAHQTTDHIQTGKVVTSQPGPKGTAKDLKTPFDCWNLFISSNIIGTVVECTNTFINDRKLKYAGKSTSTSETEVKAFIGLYYLAGIYRKCRLNDLWQSDGTGVEIFRNTMSLQRFRFLFSNLKFDDSRTRALRKSQDSFAAMRDVFDSFMYNCVLHYTPSDSVTVDDMLVPFKGKCPFKRYSSKNSKTFLKLFCLVDAKTMYTLKMEVSTSQHSGPFRSDNSPSEVVQRLISPVIGSWRNVTMDNGFMTYKLALDLLKNCHLTSVGSVKKTAPEVPPEFTNAKHRLLRSSIFGFQKDMTLISFVHVPRKTTILLSTKYHKEAIIDGITRPEKPTPEVVAFYDNTKSSVSKVAELCSTYDVSRNKKKWPLVIFSTILNIAGINAYIIHDFNTISTKKRRNFLKELALSLLSDYTKERTPGPSKRSCFETGDVGPGPSKVIRAKRCAECPRAKDRKTKNVCQKCSKFVCLEHTISLHLCFNCRKQEENERNNIIGFS